MIDCVPMKSKELWGMVFKAEGLIKLDGSVSRGQKRSTTTNQFAYLVMHEELLTLPGKSSPAKKRGKETVYQSKISTR